MVRAYKKEARDTARVDEDSMALSDPAEVISSSDQQSHAIPHAIGYWY
jgi:hypothetical protein